MRANGHTTILFSKLWTDFYPLRKYSISGEMWPILNFCGKHFWPIRKLIWLDRNIFHWRVKTDLKDYFIMYYFLGGPWIVKIINSFCSLVLSTCHNWEILVAHPHRSLLLEKTRTTATIAFLISNKVVSNPQNHSTAFNPQSFTLLSQVPGLLNRSTSVWYSNTLQPLNW